MSEREMTPEERALDAIQNPTDEVRAATNALSARIIADAIRAAESAAESRHAEAVRGLEADNKRLLDQAVTFTNRMLIAEQEVARLRAECERARASEANAHSQMRLDRRNATPPTPPDALAEAEREAAEACEELAREAVACGSETPERPWRLASLESFHRCYRALHALDAQRAAAAGAGEREALVSEALMAFNWVPGSWEDEAVRALAAKGFLTRPRGEGKS